MILFPRNLQLHLGYGNLVKLLFFHQNQQYISYLNPIFVIFHIYTWSSLFLLLQVAVVVDCQDINYYCKVVITKSATVTESSFDVLSSDSVLCPSSNVQCAFLWGPWMLNRWAWMKQWRLWKSWNFSTEISIKSAK